jgi:hypothetical protein
MVCARRCDIRWDGLSKIQRKRTKENVSGGYNFSRGALGWGGETGKGRANEDEGRRGGRWRRVKKG